jgi:parallel beta-helix repeat protein
MKTLDQVQPRILIPSLPFSITNPGSYYISTNLSVSSGDGITVLANDVTIDLMGFTLVGGGTNGSGIKAPLITASTVQTNLTVRNGTIRGWPDYGLYAVPVRGGEFEGLHVVANGSDGIFAGFISTVRQCSAFSNQFSGIFLSSGKVTDCIASQNGNYGIQVVEKSLITGCTCSQNGGSGISAERDTVLIGCSASENGFTGIGGGFGSVIKSCLAYANGWNGFLLSDASMISDCTARGNMTNGIQVGFGCMVKSCIAYGNDADGFALSDGSTISESTARGNTIHGIQIGSACTILNNTTTINGNNLAHNGGIHVSGARNRIEGNQVMSNHGDGIVVEDSAASRKNIIIKNTVAGNDDFQFRVPGVAGQGTPGDNIVPIAADVTAGTPNPWANIAP